jgi:hypothetical protein
LPEGHCRRAIAGGPLPEIVSWTTDRNSRDGVGCVGRSIWGDAARHPAGKQIRNAFIESFTGKFRDECLNEHWFLTSQEAQVVVEAWRQESNASELTVRSGM